MTIRLLQIVGRIISKIVYFRWKYKLLSYNEIIGIKNNNITLHLFLHRNTTPSGNL